ncbi:MAG: hypothetical protein ACI91J_000315 [Yoonia sp.]|jgi:hypothetical protein
MAIGWNERSLRDWVIRFFVHASRMSLPRVRNLIVVLLLVHSSALPALEICGDGRARLPIIVRAGADEHLRESAAILGHRLQQISGAVFETKSDGTRGIVLRLATGSRGLLEQENYQIRTTDRQLIITGNSPTAVRHAVWDILNRIGYRQFFPGPTWEVIPDRPGIELDVNVDESPDYHNRRIWYGYGPWDYAVEPYNDWCEKNRTAALFKLNTGHSYGRIVRDMPAEFDQHPEYFALVKGQRVGPRGNAKFCVSNSGLRRTVIAFARKYFTDKPDEASISLDPSDGGGWCECKPCEKLGSVSDRALTLANDVAAAFPDKLVGMYAYSFHSPPPHIRAQSNVIISIATAFIKGGLKIEELISGWTAKGATIGIREYYSVNTWDRDMPGKARGSNLEYLSETIPAFHAAGARFMSSESSDNWGCNGLGYHLAARLLWDVSEFENREAIASDFFDLAFEDARHPMKQFYKLIGGANKKSKLVREDLIARMYRLLDAARALTENPAVHRRLEDLTLYTRYVDLFDRYTAAEGNARQAAFEQMIRHTYRMRRTMMVHAKAIYRDVDARDKTVEIPPQAKWNAPARNSATSNPWKNETRYSPGEIALLLDEGIENRNLIELDFEPSDFSANLVPATPLKLAVTKPGSAETARGQRRWFTYVADSTKDIKLTITGGLIAHYRNRGNVKVQLWQIGGASRTGERETLITENNTVPPDGKPRTIHLKVANPGLHRIDLNDGMDLTRVTWPDHQPMTWPMSLESFPKKMNGRWNLYFYVPKGTQRIGLYAATSGGYLVDPEGNHTLDFGKSSGRFLSAPVPESQAGKLWSLAHISGRVSLLNVPPFLAADPQQLLLPSEVLESE